jgi:hypothetical protein
MPREGSPLMFELQVECYAGMKADERPMRFRLKAKDAVMHDVGEVLDQWYGIGYCCFKVRADDGNIYILRHDEAKDRWMLDSFREGNPSG